MAKSTAFVDTTILAEILLKAGPSHEAAKLALTRYSKTLLPVYAIKEWKRGQFAKYVYIHNQLRLTGSFSATNGALSKLFMRPRWQSTAFEAFAVTSLKLPCGPILTNSPEELDAELADRYRLAFRTLIHMSWEKRRAVTSDTVMELDCYVERGPRERPTGEIDIQPRDCDADSECCIARMLCKRRDELLKVRGAVPNSGRQEDRNRKEALRRLAVHPTNRFDHKDCQALGDACFALLAPSDAEILTTNLRDHAPLAEAIGKTAVLP